MATRKSSNYGAGVSVLEIGRQPEFLARFLG
jgi:hypothetical protein